MQVWPQLWGALAVAAYGGAMSWIILTVLGWVMPLRVTEEAERGGLDIALHGESVN